MKIAEIIINLPTRAVNQAFSYCIPSDLDFLEPGWRVIVPFGNREAEGFITVVRDGDASGLKQIKTALDTFPWFDNSMLRLANWLSGYYLCTLAEALRLFVPGKQGVKIEQYFCLHVDTTLPCEEVFSGCNQLLAFIALKQPVRREQLINHFGLDVLNKLKLLANHKLVKADFQAKVREKPRFTLEYRLSVSHQDFSEYRKKPAQRRLLELIQQQGSITKDTLKQMNIPLSGLQKLVESGVVVSRQIPQIQNSYAGMEIGGETLKSLTVEQKNCLENIKTALSAQQNRTFLLHGITGSGKTEIYLKAAALTRAQGRQVIVLVPEIALTGQIVNRFKLRFGDDIVVFHSKLSLRERYDAWRSLRAESAGIAIGARSAIFAPVANLGLVIVDEEHEFTYKQEESPRYHARDVAIKRAELSGAVVILGSATPSIETYQDALLERHKLLELTVRADGAVLPSVSVVDMREEMKRGRRSVISERLASLLQETISRGEQAIVLLNRRGHSTFLLCRECGHVMRCRHCAVALVYHANDNSLRCHYCRRHEPVPEICPSCMGRYIRFFGTGTQKAEEALSELLPEARILRMDQDTTSGRFSIDKILQDFQGGKYDILLGTQMVAKGHDIANVTAVGVLAADTTLNLPDFRAAEKTFALITQAAGRAGRGSKKGQVVIQTYNPEHYAISLGAAQDYKQFFAAEVEFRRSLQYPPFVRLIRCTITSENEQTAYRDANALAASLRILLPAKGVEYLGPFPASIAKVKDVFRMNILIKSDLSIDIKTKLTDVPLLFQSGISVDVDPLNMM